MYIWKRFVISHFYNVISKLTKPKTTDSERLYKGDIQFSESTMSFDEWKDRFLSEHGYVEIPCTEADPLLLVVSYARDRVPRPAFDIQIDSIFDETIKKL